MAVVRTGKGWQTLEDFKQGNSNYVPFKCRQCGILIQKVYNGDHHCFYKDCPCK